MADFSNRSFGLRFGTGAATVPRAFGMLMASPRMMGLAALPTVISVGILAALLVLSVVYGDEFVMLFWQSPGRPEGWTGWLLVSSYKALQVLSVIMCIIVSCVVALGISLIVAEPFADMLSEGAENRLGTGVAEEPFSVRHICREMLYAVRDVTLDVSLLLIIQLVILPLLLVPVAGAVVHMLLQWLVSASFASMEMMSPALGRRGIHGRSRWSVFLRNRSACLGLGTSCLIILLVPLAQLLTFPIAIVAGTITVAALERGGDLAGQRNSQ